MLLYQSGVRVASGAVSVVELSDSNHEVWDGIGGIGGQTGRF
jgi:hypothetical protein